MKKKVLVALIVAVLFVSGCSLPGGNKTNPSNIENSAIPKTKVVRIESNPGGAIVFVDNDPPVTTPADVELTLGWHFVEFRKNGYQNYVMKNVEVKEDTTEIKVSLEKTPSTKDVFLGGVLGPIVFDSVPHFACCSAAAIAYSNIFYGGIYTVSGFTSLDSFDIVFPSWKKVHFDTERTLSGVRKFSKVVTFDELGEYGIISNGEGEYSFEVCYKPKILSPTPKIEDIFPGFGIKNAITVPVGKEIEAKVIITDAKGNPIPDTSLGVYSLKTDKDGIVSFKAKVSRTEECAYCYKTYVNGQEAQIIIYADLLIWGYDYAKFTKDGKLIESSTQNANVLIQPSLLPQFKKEAKVVYEGNHVYMPYGSFGARVTEMYKGAGVSGNIIIPHPKDPSIIYTNAFVSKDEGSHFEKLEVTLDTIGIDRNNPSVILGWSRNEPKYILKSTDYGLHFEKIANVSIDLTNNFVEQILIDPSNPKRVYLGTWKGLYVSNDSASTFSLLNSDCSIVKSIAVNPKNPNIIIIGSEKGILRSEDGGKTWEVMKNNPNVDFINCIVFDPKNPNTVYAGSMYEGIFASFDCGKTWQSLHKFDLEGPQSIAVNPLKHNIVYVVSFRDGIYKSVDYGKTFAKIDFPVGNETSIAFGNNGNLFLIDDGVPFVLNDSSESFVPLDGKTFLIGGPSWKIMDNELFIDVSNIRGDSIRSKVGENYIEFYKACDMLP